MKKYKNSGKHFIKIVEATHAMHSRANIDHEGGSFGT